MPPRRTLQSQNEMERIKQNNLRSALPPPFSGPARKDVNSLGVELSPNYDRPSVAHRGSDDPQQNLDDKANELDPRGVAKRSSEEPGPSDHEELSERHGGGGSVRNMSTWRKEKDEVTVSGGGLREIDRGDDARRETNRTKVMQSSGRFLKDI